MRGIASVVILALLTLVGVPWGGAFAGGDVASVEKSWKADPKGTWRKLGWDEANITSTCLGKSISPICAVENKLACYMQAREELCHVAILDHEGVQFIHSTKRATSISTLYRISSVKKIVRDKSVTLTGELARTGDYLVDLRYVQCNSVTFDHCDRDFGPPTTHLVRKIGDEWRLVTWDTPRW